MVEQQEKQNIQHSKLKRKSRIIPFGYKLDNTENYLIKIESELQALEKAKVWIEFNKYKIDPDKPAEDKSKPISDPARFKNLKFGKVYSGKTRKAKYTV